MIFTIKQQRLISSIVAIAFIFIIWAVLAELINEPFYLPKIDVVYKSFINLVKEDMFSKNILTTLLRTFIAYCISLLLALFISVLLVKYDILTYFFKPINAIIMSLPPMVLIVLIIIWTNAGNVPIVLGFVITYPIIFEQLLSNLKNTKTEYSEMLNTFNVSLSMKIKKIYLPTIIFAITTTFISTFLITFKMVIAGEVFAFPEYGIGAIIQYEKFMFNIPRIYAWLVVIIVLTFILLSIQNVLNRKLFRWKYE